MEVVSIYHPMHEAADDQLGLGVLTTRYYAEQIGRELDLLRERGVHSVFFVDDNFIGNQKAAKGLLRYLADHQERHDYRFIFSTEVSRKRGSGLDS